MIGLLICGGCGGGYTIVAQDRYGCATRKGKGTCANNRTIMRPNIERRVLGALRNSLLTTALVDEFIVALEAATADNRKDILGRQLGLQKELTGMERKIEGLMRSIEMGAWTPTIGERLKALEARQGEVTDLLRVAASPAPKPQLSVRGAEIYREKVAGLAVALNDPLIRAEAAEALRSLINTIVLTPDAGVPDGISAELQGELATILGLAANPVMSLGPNGKKPQRTNVPRAMLSVVAGIGFEPMTFRL